MSSVSSVPRRSGTFRNGRLLGCSGSVSRPPLGGPERSERPENSPGTPQNVIFPMRNGAGTHRNGLFWQFCKVRNEEEVACA